MSECAPPDQPGAFTGRAPVCSDMYRTFLCITQHHMCTRTGSRYVEYIVDAEKGKSRDEDPHARYEIEECTSADNLQSRSILQGHRAHTTAILQRQLSFMRRWMVVPRRS